MRALNRRNLLKSAVVAPLVVPSHIFGANDKINLGVVGCGARGTAVMDEFLKLDDVRVVMVCDVDKFHYREHTTRHGRPYGLDPAQATVEKKYGGDFKCDVTNDFRELCARDDIDAVLVATPDHWHALITLEALRNGKDVYCEKPVTHRFAEGQAVVAEVAKQKAIFQVGSQQRSADNFQQAVDAVRNGNIGAIKRVEVGLPAGYSSTESSTTPEEPPAQLDYDFWCGPSPVMPYMRARHHRWWRGHTNFGGGNLMDWIGHHNDIAHWALGMDKSGPLSVEAKGWTKSPVEVYDTPVDFEVHCEYPGNIDLVISTKLTGGTKWIGEDGWVYVNRGKLEASNKALLLIGKENSGVKSSNTIVRGATLPSHQQNFAESIRSRKPCLCEAETGHRSVTPGHLGFISQKLGRKLKWDAEKESVIGDDEADQLLKAVNYRGEWSLG